MAARKLALLTVMLLSTAAFGEGLEHAEAIRAALEKSEYHFQSGNYEAAEVLLLEVLDPARQLDPSPELLRMQVVRALAAVSHNLGRFERAARYHQEALQVAEEVMPPGDPGLFLLVSNVASIHIELEEFELAEPLTERAFALYEANASTFSEPEKVFNLGYVSWLVGSTRLGLNRPRDAKQPLEIALAAFRSLDVNPRHAGNTQHKLGLTEHALGNEEAARKHLEEAVETLGRVLPPGDPYLESAKSDLARVRADSDR